MEDLVATVWSELKRYVNTVDRQEAAEAMVSVLVDNDCDIEDIRQAFKGDNDVKRALADYLDDGVHDEDDDEDPYEDDWEE